MLGLGDFTTAAAMIGCILVTLFGVIYGTVNWNNGGEDDLARKRLKRRKKNRKKNKNAGVQQP